jgi:hypothetical protein
VWLEAVVSAAMLDSISMAWRRGAHAVCETKERGQRGTYRRP